MSLSVPLLAEKLKEAGCRLTQPRLAVIQALEESSVELSPDEVHVRGRVICPSLGLVTVYRTLDLLVALGLAQRVHSDSGCRGYALAAEDHHHVVCQRCHQVAAFPCDGLGELIQRVQDCTGYRVHAHLVELTGLCPNCQNAVRDGSPYDLPSSQQPKH